MAYLWILHNSRIIDLKDYGWKNVDAKFTMTWVLGDQTDVFKTSHILQDTPELRTSSQH